MENSPAPPQPPASPQRKVALRHASVRTDESSLQRTAAFTDGTTGVVAMQWDQVRRIAAFRRDVMTEPTLCIAISDPANIIVLDESMEGWHSLLEAMPRHLTAAPGFNEWRAQIPANSSASHWTILYRDHPPH